MAQPWIDLYAEYGLIPDSFTRGRPRQVASPSRASAIAPRATARDRPSARSNSSSAWARTRSGSTVPWSQRLARALALGLGGTEQRPRGLRAARCSDFREQDELVDERPAVRSSSGESASASRVCPIRVFEPPELEAHGPDPRSRPRATSGSRSPRRCARSRAAARAPPRDRPSARAMSASAVSTCASPFRKPFRR